MNKRYGLTFGNRVVYPLRFAIRGATTLLPKVRPYLLVVLLMTACSQRPIEELSLADVAIKAAQKARADSFASDTYRKAENYYLRAKKDFNEGYFDSSKKNADEARRLAEQAEYQAIYKQNKAKDKIISPTGTEEMPPPEVTPIPENP